MTDSNITQDLLHFIESSPTPYHAVASAAARLRSAGFRELLETAAFTPLDAGRYFVTRGDGTLVAFVVPSSASGLRGFRIIGAHTDSPNLRLKPRPEYMKEGYLQLGVEVYGGVLLNSWLDRDLSVAGRVIVREEGRLSARLIRIARPLLRIPQLAIHLDREVNERGLILNKQEHLSPILALSGVEPQAGERLIGMLASELGVDATRVVRADLMLYDVAPPTLAGLDGEFIFSPRLDNQAMCHAALGALLGAVERTGGDEGIIPLIALFDHEEVGSGSAHGAHSPILPSLLERILMALGLDREGYHRVLAGSLCVSADMAHAVHPNYADRHEGRHRPALNGGPVIKLNSQQRYATCAATASLFQELCRLEDVPVQLYAHRTDLPCGTTIGPITATLLGIRTVDVGSAMLSMHSAREMAGSRDPALMTRVLTRFLGCPDPF